MALATRGPPPGLPNQVPPSQTLYITNLPDKVRKPELKKNLYMLFATYGVVLDINLMARTKMRGQAHVVFRDIDTSTQAMRALQNFNFFGKELKIQYSKNKSETIAKLDGTIYELRAKPTTEEGAQPADAAAAIFGGTAPVRKLQPVNVPQEKATSADEEPKGVKRARDAEEEEDEDDDEDAAMDVSDSD